MGGDRGRWAAALHRRVERVRVRDLVLLEDVGEVVLGGVDALARYQPPLVHRVLARLAEGHELDVQAPVGEIEAGDPADGGEGVLAGPLQIGTQPG